MIISRDLRYERRHSRLEKKSGNTLTGQSEFSALSLLRSHSPHGGGQQQLLVDAAVVVAALAVVVAAVAAAAASNGRHGYGGCRPPFGCTQLRYGDVLSTLEKKLYFTIHTTFTFELLSSVQ